MEVEIKRTIVQTIEKDHVVEVSSCAHCENAVLISSKEKRADIAEVDALNIIKFLKTYIPGEVFDEVVKQLR